MEINETFKIIFGGTIITAIAAFVAITSNFFNINDRIKKWRNESEKSKFKKNFHENNPDFKFTLNFISDPNPRKCILHATILNISKEIKFIESFEYKFEDPKNPNMFEPSNIFMNGEKWPKRLEHGERFASSVDFSMTLPNVAFQYWHKGFKVYCSSKSSTGDFLRSNSVDFDKLMEFMEPVKQDYKNLAVLLANNTGGSVLEIEISLWQLQIFQRITVHIVKQLHYNNIPIVEYLIEEHKLTVEKDIWSNWYRELEERKIQPAIIDDFLKRLI
jgi:hypothetical protein